MNAKKWATNVVDHGSDGELQNSRDAISAFVVLFDSRARVRADTFFNKDVVRDPWVCRLSFFLGLPGFFGFRLFLGSVDRRADFAELERKRHIVVALRSGAVDRFFD